MRRAVVGTLYLNDLGTRRARLDLQRGRVRWVDFMGQDRTSQTSAVCDVIGEGIRQCELLKKIKNVSSVDARGSYSTQDICC